jgi:hypothetical protein
MMNLFIYSLSKRDMKEALRKITNRITFVLWWS